MSFLEYTDFSGGVTDHDIPGVTNKYSLCENLLLDHNKRLYQRDGFDIFSTAAYQLTAGVQVGRLVNFDNNSELFALQNKKLFYISGGAWSELTGPNGGHSIFPSNVAASVTSEAQWNHHLFLASNSGDPVVKLYRDGSSNLQLRTAGLPAPATPLIYTTAAAQLAQAIVLALDIKNSLKAHVNDFGVSPAAHLTKDTTTYNSLNALVDPVTLGDLITYVKSLRTNYNFHLADAKTRRGGQVYHIGLSDEGGGGTYQRNPMLNLLSDSSLPADADIDTLLECVRVLNDLRNRYNWHVVAPLTHNNATQTSVGWGAHQVATAVLDINAVYPTISNVAPLVRYVNYLKAEYNAHAVDTTAHLFANGVTDADSANQVKMADCTDLHTAIGVLGCLAFHYSEHIGKANAVIDPSGSTYGAYYIATDQYALVYSGTITSGSKNIASTATDATATVTKTFPDGGTCTFAGGLPVGYFIPKLTDDSTAPFTAWRTPAAVMQTPSNVDPANPPTATTIKMTSNFTASGTFTFAFHWNNIHMDIERNATAAILNPAMALLFTDTIDFSLADISTPCTMAKSIALMLKAHVLSQWTPILDADFAEGIWSTTYIPPQKNTTFYRPVDNSGNIYISPHRSIYDTYIGGFKWPKSATLIATEQYTGQQYFEAGLSTASYEYKLVNRYDYNVGSTAFSDFSTPSTSLLATTIESGISLTAGDTGVARDPISFTNIQVLANSSVQNYDTSNIKIEIYRTINNGTQGFLVGSLTNGTTTFSDTVLDSALTNNAPLYTNGGQVANDAPPAATYIHFFQGRMYYAVGTKVYVSLDQDPDSVPADFFDTFDETVVGISSTSSSVVVLTLNAVHRLEGTFDELGNGFLSHQTIYNKTGCISAQSIVKAEEGIFFAGLDGFYFTDAVQCFRVSDLVDTFLSYTLTAGRQTIIQGCYQPTEKRCFWTIQKSGSASSCDQIWVLDLKFGIAPDSMPVTMFAGGFDGYLGFNPTAVAVFNRALHYGDSDGYIFKQSLSLNLDLTKATGTAATAWAKRTILWDFKSCHTDAGSGRMRKIFLKVFPQFKQATNLSVQIISDADRGRITSSLPIIRSRKLLDWGDSKIAPGSWTNPVFTAKAGTVIDEFRRFKSDGSLRSNFRALELRNAYCVIVASDEIGLCTIANISTHVWSLTLSGALAWPLYAVGYFARINGVDYPVTVRTSDTVIRVDDTGLTALSIGSSIKWELWGYPKNEQVEFLQYQVQFELLGQQQKDYQGTTSLDGGQNA